MRNGAQRPQGRRKGGGRQKNTTSWTEIDNKGDRIDVGPSDIVCDQSLRGGFIINGISCLSCHDQGMKTASDELRDHTAKNRFRFDRRDFDLLQQMHVSQPKLSELLTRDAKRLQDAVERAARAGGLQATAKSEPVRFVFDLMLNASQAVAEMGATPDTLEELKGAGGKLRSLVVKMEGRGVKREEFLAEFPTLVEALRLGEYRRPKPLRLPIFDPTSQTGEPLIDDRSDNAEFAIRLRTDTGRTSFKLGDKLTLLVEADRD